MRIRGAIEKKTARSVNGWVAITEEPGPVVLEVLHAGKVVGKVEAGEMRPDVRQAGFGDGRSGISFRLPPSTEDANPDDIELILLGTEIYLSSRRAELPVEKPTSYGEGSVFILGPARSGTSVMFLALQKVMGLSGLGESHVPQIFQRMVFQFYEYVNKFSGDVGVLAHRLPVPEFRTHMIRFLRQFYYDQFAGSPFVDKTPGLEALVGAPFLKEAFPAAKIIVMERNGVETIESYRRKFGATFEEASKEWADCARETAALKLTMPEALFLDQNVMRCEPDVVATKIMGHLGTPGLTLSLSDFLSNNRVDVLLPREKWTSPLTIDNVAWTEEEKAIYRSIGC